METPKEWADRCSKEALDKNAKVAEKLGMKMKFRESYERFLEDFQKENRLPHSFRWNLLAELMKSVMFNDTFDNDFEINE